MPTMTTGGKSVSAFSPFANNDGQIKEQSAEEEDDMKKTLSKQRSELAIASARLSVLLEKKKKHAAARRRIMKSSSEQSPGESANSMPTPTPRRSPKRRSKSSKSSRGGIKSLRDGYDLNAVQSLCSENKAELTRVSSCLSKLIQDCKERGEATTKMEAERELIKSSCRLFKKELHQSTMNNAPRKKVAKSSASIVSALSSATDQFAAINEQAAIVPKVNVNAEGNHNHNNRKPEQEKTTTSKQSGTGSNEEPFFSAPAFGVTATNFTSFFNKQKNDSPKEETVVNASSTDLPSPPSKLEELDSKKEENNQDIDLLVSLLDKTSRKLEAKEIFINSKVHNIQKGPGGGSLPSKSHERNYDKDPTELFTMLHNKMWSDALEQIDLCPDECRIWVTRFKDEGVFQWRLLPLHVAIIFKAPLEVVKTLLQVYPEAVTHQDDRNMLPVDLALKKKRPQAIVKLLKKVSRIMDERPERLECKYDEDPSELFLLLQHQMWDEATRYATNYPRECKTWVSRFGDDGAFRWRLLPLHIAIIFNAPVETMAALLTAYPEAARHQDDAGMLPVDLAVKKKSPKAVVQLIENYANYHPASSTSNPDLFSTPPRILKSDKSEPVAGTPSTAFMDEDCNSMLEDDRDFGNTNEGDKLVDPEKIVRTKSFFPRLLRPFFSIGEACRPQTSCTDDSLINEIMALEAQDYLGVCRDDMNFFFDVSVVTKPTNERSRKRSKSRTTRGVLHTSSNALVPNIVAKDGSLDMKKVDESSERVGEDEETPPLTEITVVKDEDDIMTPPETQSIALTSPTPQTPNSSTFYKCSKLCIKEISKRFKGPKIEASWLFQRGNGSEESSLHLVKATINKRSGKMQIEMDEIDVFTRFLRKDAPYLLHKWESKEGYKMQVLANFQDPVLDIDFHLSVNGVHFKHFPLANFNF